MFGTAGRNKKLERALQGLGPKHLRVERLRTMRFYRRQQMAHALQRARAELAVRRASPAVAMWLLVAAALGVVIALGARALWWHQ